MKKLIFRNEQLERHDHGKKRHGGPRQNWIEETMKSFWERTVKARNQDITEELDLNDINHLRLIYATAKDMEEWYGDTSDKSQTQIGELVGLTLDSGAGATVDPYHLPAQDGRRNRKLNFHFSVKVI